MKQKDATILVTARFDKREPKLVKCVTIATFPKRTSVYRKISGPCVYTFHAAAVY